jgi:hypothetical protein
MTTRFTQDLQTPEAAEQTEVTEATEAIEVIEVIEVIEAIEEETEEGEEETSIVMDQVLEVWIESSTKEDQWGPDQSQAIEDLARKGAQDHTETPHQEATMTSM